LLVIAEHFLNEGARVFLMDSGCPELARAFHNVQTGLTCVRGDVSDLKELDRLLAEIEREEGKLDIVVANGVAAEYPTMREILVAPYEATMNLNLAALLSGAERALPFVRDGGSIILNTALATGGRSGADSLYVVARAAILFVAQLWSRQLEERWIRVNAIGPSTGGPPQHSRTALEAWGSSTSFSHYCRSSGRTRHLRLRTLWFLFYATTVVMLGELSWLWKEIQRDSACFQPIRLL
jgi:NAD(P)-dependent dehydrogenase (short-subunit alcohol dehydrogenase family)